MTMHLLSLDDICFCGETNQYSPVTNTLAFVTCDKCRRVYKSVKRRGAFLDMICDDKKAIAGVPIHLHVTGDNTFFCNSKENLWLYTNVSHLVTCNKCMVSMDKMCENSEMIIRHITHTVATSKTAGEFISTSSFFRMKESDGVFMWDRDEIDELHFHTGLSKEELVKQLRASGMTPNPNQNKGKIEYVFNSGGTFGWHGLR